MNYIGWSWSLTVRVNLLIKTFIVREAKTNVLISCVRETSRIDIVHEKRHMENTGGNLNHSLCPRYCSPPFLIWCSGVVQDTCWLDLYFNKLSIFTTATYGNVVATNHSPPHNVHLTFLVSDFDTWRFPKAYPKLTTVLSGKDTLCNNNNNILFTSYLNCSQ